MKTRPYEGRDAQCASPTHDITVPPQEGTARQKNTAHARLAPDYRPTSSVRCWVVFDSNNPNPPPAESAPRGIFPRKNIPKLGRNSVEKGFFW